MHAWFQTPAGQYLLRWEQAQIDAAVADIFGYHALQLGLPAVDGLGANRMPHRWLAVEQGWDSNAHTGADAETDNANTRAAVLACDFTALPFQSSSLDLVVMPHTLELSADPHTTLREVERVLVPEGRLVVCGLNPLSLWGLRQARGHLYQRLRIGGLYLPSDGDFISHWRLRDWLRLLGLEVETDTYGCYRPAVRSAHWLRRFAWMDPVGARWWRALGASYMLVATKRVRGMRLLGPAWKTQPVAGRKRMTAVSSRINRTRNTHE